MSKYSPLQKICVNALLSEVRDWKNDPSDHVSWNKASIILLLTKLLPETYDAILRAALLKREYTGASKFVFWATACAHSPSSEKGPVYDQFGYRFNRKAISNNLWPNIHFLDWARTRFQYHYAPHRLDTWDWCFGTVHFTLPEWDLLSIADYADKYTQLIDQLCEEFDIDFKAPLKINLEVASDKQADLPHQINEFFFLKRCDYLYKLSKEIAEASVAQYCQDPVEKIMKAFENIGKTSNINYSDGINTPWIGKKSNLLSDE